MQQRTTGGFAFAILLVTLATAAPAAAIDLGGDYVGFALVPFTVNFVQTGTALQMSGHIVSASTEYPLSAIGTVDPATGAFSVSGEITGVCPDFVYSGTGDGEELTGTFTSNTCPTGPVFLTKCGNGVIDPLENCEDGNDVDGDCCSTRCRLDAAGTACTGERIECTDDVCDVTGTCTHVPVTRPCDDGNACTVGDVCAAGACAPGPPAPAGVTCDDDFDPCTADVCGAAGTCTHVPVSRAECRRAVACHSTCTEQLKACRRTCPAGGQARRECRAACAERSTCTAPGAAIRTLAYVVTDCSTDPQRRSTLKQKLLVRRGNCDPVTVMELDAGPPEVDPSGLCRAYGEARSGRAAPTLGFFQRVAVLPDGSGVVFEVTSQWSPLPSVRRPPEEGFFFVRADGRGRRPLGPPSRVPAGVEIALVSPDGRYLVLRDLGPDREGHEAQQLFRLDARSGERLQLTHQSGTICCASFLNPRTVLVHDIPGSPGLAVETDGKRPEHRLPFVMLPDGGTVISRFEVTGGRAFPLFVYFTSRPAVNSPVPGVSEMFLLDGERILQLTNFDRNDTFRFGGFVIGGRVLFPASVNHAGENPDEICQLFSISTLGTDLRQVTHLPSDGRPLTFGCLFNEEVSTRTPATRCTISAAFRDPITGTVLFESSCDPGGGNPFGDQLFAMRPDGTGLRQLTNTRGMTIDPDGTIHVELPGPVAYPFPTVG
jgi:cysteine-rich repeat protein